MSGARVSGGGAYRPPHSRSGTAGDKRFEQPGTIGFAESPPSTLRKLSGDQPDFTEPLLRLGQH